MDAEYVIAAELSRDLNEQVPLYAEAQQLEVAIDGERVGLFTLRGRAARRRRREASTTTRTQPAISQIAPQLLS